MFLHQVLHYFPCLPQVIFFGLYKALRPLFILLSGSLFDFIAYSILLEIRGLKFLYLDFGVVIQLRFKGL
jgi:hypothetical protein